jgi:hypothetical protein
MKQRGFFNRSQFFWAKLERTKTMSTLTIAEATNLVPVQNGTELSLLDTLITRYMTFAKASAENFVRMAQTLIEAKSKLRILDFVDFCRRVGLEHDGSTYRKLLIIGRQASRFESVFDRMPANWTTVYKLATLEKDKFDRVTSDERFSPMMTGSEVDLIVKGKSGENSTRLSHDCFIHLAGFETPKKREFCEKLEAFSKEYGFKYTISSRLKKELNPKPWKPRRPKWHRPRPRSNNGPSLREFLKD